MKLFPWRRKTKPVSTARPLPPRYLSYQCAVMQGVGGRDYQEDSWTIVNADDVSKILEKEGYKDIKTVCDYGKNQRVVIGTVE